MNEDEFAVVGRADPFPGRWGKPPTGEQRRADWILQKVSYDAEVRRLRSATARRLRLRRWLAEHPAL